MIRFPLAASEPSAVRTADELALMAEAGRIVALAHEAIRLELRPGVSTAALNAIAEEVIRSQGAVPSFLGYQGYPAAICASINDEAVHGIPQPQRLLVEGDIVSIDIGAAYQGWVGDSARTYAIGRIPSITQRLLEVTEAALWAGIEQARPNNRLGDISAAIQRYVEGQGFTIVREHTGHGIGRHMHEQPLVLNYGNPGVGPRLHPGMTLALEPVAATNGWRTKIDADGWTSRTLDGGLCAHFEHTIAITTNEARILTLLPSQSISNQLKL